MSQLNYSRALVAGTPENVNDVQTMFNDVQAILNGAVDDVNLASGTKDKLGLTDATIVRRGKFVQATAGSRTNVAYGALSNGPDQVSSVVLPTDGLFYIGYSALWQESVLNAAKAAIFIGATQLKSRQVNAAPAVSETGLSAASGVNFYVPLSTVSGGGVVSGGGGALTTDSTSVTTGQIVGGICIVEAAAGTYDVSVQFKASSGSVTVKERKLWVRAEAY